MTPLRGDVSTTSNILENVCDRFVLKLRITTVVETNLDHSIRARNSNRKRRQTIHWGWKRMMKVINIGISGSRNMFQKTVVLGPQHVGWRLWGRCHIDLCIPAIWTGSTFDISTAVKWGWREVDMEQLLQRVPIKTTGIRPWPSWTDRISTSCLLSSWERWCIENCQANCMFQSVDLRIALRRERNILYVLRLLLSTTTKGGWVCNRTVWHFSLCMQFTQITHWSTWPRHSSGG
jgi:hypothetical protein